MEYKDDNTKMKYKITIKNDNAKMEYKNDNTKMTIHRCQYKK